MGLTYDHGIETGSNAKKVANGFGFVVLVEMRLERLRINGEMFVEVEGKLGLAAFVADDQLDSITGGENHPFTNTGMREKRTCFVGKFLGRDGEAFAQLDGRGFVIQACEKNLHEAVNLWTELKRLAAQTQSMTRKTTEDR